MPRLLYSLILAMFFGSSLLLRAQDRSTDGNLTRQNTSELAALTASAIQVIVDSQAGVAFIPTGTILPRGLQISVSAHNRPSQAKRGDLQFDLDGITSGSVIQAEGGEVNLSLSGVVATDLSRPFFWRSDLFGFKPRKVLTFQYTDQADFEPYRARLDRAISSLYAKRTERAKKGGARAQRVEDYSTIVVYLPHATQTGSVGLSSTRIGIEGETEVVREMDYFLVWEYSDDQRFTTSHYDCLPYNNCFIYVENDRHPSAYPVTTASTCVSYGWEGSQGVYGYDEDNCIDWVLYD